MKAPRACLARGPDELPLNLRRRAFVTQPTTVRFDQRALAGFEFGEMGAVFAGAPDVLGGVDHAVRVNGDAVHVHRGALAAGTENRAFFGQGDYIGYGRTAAFDEGNRAVALAAHVKNIARGRHGDLCRRTPFTEQDPILRERGKAYQADDGNAVIEAVGHIGLAKPR